MMSFGSVCSGIEAASVAWHPIGWQAAWLAEIEPFPCAVLAHHYPNTPNLGDMTKIAKRVLSGDVLAPDVLCGGTPCQAFSVAGLRKSLDDERGNLTLKFVELADAIDHVRAMRGEHHTVIVWENVPGVLSTKDNAFGCFLAGLAGENDPLQPPGGRWANAGAVFGPARAVAWRTLDAQYFGVAQRRRRVFVVASARDGFDPAAVLFEWGSVRRDTAPRREAGQISPTIPARSTGGGGLGTDFDLDGGVIKAFGGNNTSGPIDQAAALNANRGCHNPGDFEAGTLLVQPVAFHPTQDPISSTDGTTHAMGCGSSGGQASVAVAFAIQAGALRTNPNSGPDGIGVQSDHAYTLEARAEVQAVAFQERGRDGGQSLEIGGDVAYALTAPNGGGRAQERNVLTPSMQVRRLTPTECERLQGFPDGYTAIPWRKKPATECPDGPRYKALGNSWAVPVVRWIGARIDMQLKGAL